MDNNLLLQVALYVLGVGAVYGGIRADLRHLHEKADAAKESARRAHSRLDDLILTGRAGQRMTDSSVG